MVAASAIGYYGPHRGDELLTEDSPPGDGFLADVVADWEAASTPASDAGLRLVLIRTGIVQDPRGGTLRLLWPLAEVGAGGRLGRGHQWVSWIGIDDLADIYYRALIDDTLAGPVNATSPHPVRGAEYAGVLAHVLRRPLQLPVPALGPRLVLGEQGASELAEADQRVSPRRLLAAVTASATPNWSQPCATCSAVPPSERTRIDLGADRRPGLGEGRPAPAESSRADS